MVNVIKNWFCVHALRDCPESARRKLSAGFFVSPPDRLPVDPPPRFWLGFLFYGDDMTSEHMQALRAEVLLPTYAGMTDAEVAEALNAETIDAWRPVPVEAIKSWAVQQQTPTGEFLVYALKQVALTAAHPAAGLADNVLEAVGVNMAPWQMDAPRVLAQMEAIVAAGLMTQGQVDELKAMGAAKVSRAQQLIGRPAAEYEVTGALYTDTGERRI